MYFKSLLFSLAILAFQASSVNSGRIHLTRAGICQPFHTNFDDASQLAHHHITSSTSAPFVVISDEDSYRLGTRGLEMYLEQPDSKVTTKDNVNDIVGDGATINSTFTLLYGKITFEISAPAVAGVVSAAILIGDDEIDIELVGGEPGAWQTNIFAPHPQDQEPLWGVFGTVEDFLQPSKIDVFHKYTVDWNKDRIIWSVDGTTVRTLKEEQTRKNGVIHYPFRPTRIQLGIWDASNPAGTSEWAHGPIDWHKAPKKMVAYVRSLTVECPES